MNNQRMQQRYGSYAKLVEDEANTIPYEFAVATVNDPAGTTGKGLYFAFEAGKLVRLITYAEAEQMVSGAIESLRRELGLE